MANANAPISPTTSRRRVSRKQRRGRAGLSPREVAEGELAAGTISQVQFEKRRERIALSECSSEWGDDVWQGVDRDYAAERASGRGTKLFTGSGSRKVACDRCHRLTPPQNCHGGRCDDCKLHAGSEFFLHNLPGSGGLRLRGEE